MSQQSNAGTQHTQPNNASYVVDEEDAAPFGTLVPLNVISGLAVVELVNAEYKFGRSSTCDFSFPKNSEISGEHCTLFVENNSSGNVARVLVRDESSNGTYLNGEKIGKGKVAELKHGAELSLGVKSSAAAKKGSLKHSFVAFIYKSGSGEEQDVHEAFQETGGPSSTYECSKALGSGAFAEVRLCFHRRTGTKYAAKIVDKNKFALNKELRKGSFRDEVEILKSINSPYIVRCEDIFETDNYLTIILQYVSGGDLFDKLVALKRYQESDAKIVFFQMAHGVKYLHNRDIAHRDLKPENFLVRSDKSDVLVLMGDFGLARVFSGEAKFMKTLCGTPQYLAPEVIEQARANKMEGYTQAVDVWSLGVILYILLAGYPPFGPKDFEDILRAKFDFKHDRWKSVSESAKQLIRRMLAREPAERATIDQIVNDPWLQGVNPPAIPADLDALPATSSQAARVVNAAASPRKAKAVDTAGDKKKAAVRFEQPEKERVPTEALVDSSGSRRKLREREPTGVKRDRKGDEEEGEGEGDGEDETKKDKGGKKEARKEEADVTEASLKRLRVAELRERCAAQGLEQSGTKAVLIDRLLKK